jgi:predicted NBD/HSP70 family sugar kinase
MRIRHGPDEGARHAAQLRGLNLDRVLAVAMEATAPFTRRELIRSTGLSAPTVGSLASHLIHLGLLTDLGAGPSQGGRRPARMQFNARHAFVAAIDLGPSRTHVAVADLLGDVLARRVVPTPPGLTPEALLTAIVAELRQVLATAGVPVGRLAAVAAAAPGVVDRDTGTVSARNLAGWSLVPMADLLSRSLDIPVVVDNDVNLAILGERWRGAARGHETCAFLLFGTGIGAGIVIGGQLHHGHHGLAGEIASMCLGPPPTETDSDGYGCLESLAGLKALAARWVPGRVPPDDAWLAEMFGAAANGDPRAAAIVDEAGVWLGLAAANLSVVLDPSLIVLGGELILRGPSLLDHVRRVVGRVVSRPSRIVVSELGDDASLWGSLLVATTEARARLRQRLRDKRAP